MMKPMKRLFGLRGVQFHSSLLEEMESYWFLHLYALLDWEDGVSSTRRNHLVPNLLLSYCSFIIEPIVREQWSICTFLDHWAIDFVDLPFSSSSVLTDGIMLPHHL